MQIIIGAGPIGTHIARKLTERGTPVRVLTRSGSGLDHPLVARSSVDATDPSALAAAISGATVVYACFHASAYDPTTWRAELPAAERTLLEQAHHVGATVVFPESLYAFRNSTGHADESQPLTEDSALDHPSPLGQIRAELLSARAASPTPTISVVASDYFGPLAGQSAHIGDRVVGPATSGTTVRPLGRIDLAHSWTYLPDLAEAMIAAAELPTIGDRILFAPTGAPRTQRQVAEDYARAAGRDRVKVAPIPSWVLRALGVVDRQMRSMASMSHLLTEPLVMDSSTSERLLGLTPTPWDEAIKQTVAAFGSTPATTPDHVG